MDASMSTQEQQLCQLLMELPARHKYRYTEAASRELLYNLFWSMAGGKPEYMRLFFPDGSLTPKAAGRLREAQGAVEGAEYTEAARGKPCGHIFKAGEASYACRTCSTDDTCCLCSKCFNATAHQGHMVRINISPGNSGCCDCGDPEAWKVPLFCTIHTEREQDKGKGKEREGAGLPPDLVDNIRMTIGRVFDYMCDVVSCSPEQLRQAKTVESVELDELQSRLKPTYYGGDMESPQEFSLLLWNDEKHTVTEVRDQVARACRMRKDEGMQRALETDSVGRSILHFDASIQKLLDIAKIIEQIKVTVTIRSSRDTFREQMVGTMVEWLSDIAGCRVGNDNNVLRVVVCQEMLKPWREGSPASRANVGGMDDEDKIAQAKDSLVARQTRFLQQVMVVVQAGGGTAVAAAVANGGAASDSGEDDDYDDDEEEEDAEMGGAGGAGGADGTRGTGANRTPSSGDEDEERDGGDEEGGEEGEEGEEDEDDMMLLDERNPLEQGSRDVDMSDWREDQPLEVEEATMAGYPPPPPPPPAQPRGNRTIRDRDLTPSDSDTAEPLIAPTVFAKANIEVPRTPGAALGDESNPPKPGRYWLGTPPAYMERGDVPTAEDVFKRVRLDWLILFDLRMWKKVRNDLRSLYISTVVTIPEFKRVLGLRFSGLYTTLAQLYLIGDREPDHSIINLSLQMLTTPSITAEIVERGNFLTNLMAILYTFLTTRQVGHPWELSSTAVLAFDSGTVTNRRMYHFFTDLKYLFGSPHVQDRLRTEEVYMMQFLDLVKLHQGICPNVRAVGEHVEYETDSWISASLITREINKLCRQFAESFKNVPPADSALVARAIRLAAKGVILSSIGAERARFSQAEVKDEVRFKSVTDFEFDNSGAPAATKYDVVKFVVEEQPISFHHALHYTLSWLVEHGRAMTRDQLRSILSFTTAELKAKPRSMGRKTMPKRDYQAEDYLMAAFDYPLRVCAWLAQMKAGMWVRNGISLRHQSGTYRGVQARDVSHHRDIFLLQTALVVCSPGRVLASIIDRYGLERWVKGFFEQKSTGQDDSQHLDVVEDMIHVLIVLLSDRTSLIPVEDEPLAIVQAMRRDISHVLCFKPLSFNEICNKIPDKYQEQEEFHQVLEEMATFKAPEGLSDVGTFELKPHFIEDVDPYIAHYNKNQREESETAYRKWMAKKTGKPAEDIVYEPKLRPIPSGVFTGLAEFTSTGMFAQIMYYSLLYPLVAPKLTPNVPFTRIETFLQVVLHLILIAISEDRSDEDDMTEESLRSFVYIALTRNARSSLMADAPGARTIVALLDMMSTREELKSCHAKIALILKRMRQKRPSNFESAYLRLGVSVDRISTASPANNSNADEERERKKRAALDRQAKVMAQFQQQQKSFLESQGSLDWGDENLEDDEATAEQKEQKNFWKYPAGTCILCQEDTDDRRLYGTFAFFTESQILRQTDFQDPDFVREAANTPVNLDKSAEELRPFGVAHENRKMVEKVDADGSTFWDEQQVIGKGFPPRLSRSGPVSIGCGHVMHFTCFEMYFDATQRRHGHQIARHHPEDLESLEFVCPLCKALGNAFVPVVWKGKEESYPGALNSERSFKAFLNHHMFSEYYALGARRSPDRVRLSFSDYISSTMVNGVGEKASQLLIDAWESNSPTERSGTPFSDSFSPVATPESSVRSGQAGMAGGSSMTKELVAVYRRLRETIRRNGLPTMYPEATQENTNELYSSDTLAKSVGFSISAVEIQQRGVEAQYGMTLLEKIPDQVLTHLRILAETATSYIAVGGLRHGGDNRIDTEYRKDSERQHCQLFMSEYFGKETDNVRQPSNIYQPLLSQDTFIFLCECVFGVAQAQSMDISHLVRICYLAELVKVVYHMGRNIPAGVWFSSLIHPGTDDKALQNFAHFCLSVTQMGVNASAKTLEPTVDDGQNNEGFNQPGLNTLEGYYSFVTKYALAFLRKTAVLLHVKFGVDFNSRVSPDPDADELARLTEMMRVPSFDEMCAALTHNGKSVGWDEDTTERLVTGWIRHQTEWPRSLHEDGGEGAGGSSSSSSSSSSGGSSSSASSSPSSPGHQGLLPPRSAMLSHPGIFELLGLPRNYDTLLEECSKRRCPTTGKDLSDPMLCLTCGDVFCGQGACCLKVEPASSSGRTPLRKIGGTQQHMRKCQKNMGIFISIRKCCVYYVHRNSGSWGNAPYIDKYGEVDMGLRHGRQLFLNQKRYDNMLRTIWLGHSVPSFVARKLEADINNGGWETI